MSRARALRRKATGTEVELWTALRGARSNGWKFRRQHPIDRFVADFVCVKAMLVIEIDGATHASPDARARDFERTRLIEAAGFHMIRIQNADVVGNLDGVLETILGVMISRVHL